VISAGQARRIETPAACVAGIKRRGGAELQLGFREIRHRPAARAAAGRVIGRVERVLGGRLEPGRDREACWPEIAPDRPERAGSRAPRNAPRRRPVRASAGVPARASGRRELQFDGAR
jgi:hypothetical protein